MRLIFILLLFVTTFAQFPECECDQVVTHGDYTLCYSEKHEQAKWVMYKSELEDIIPGVDDPKVSLLLNAIMADERKHHKLLKRIADVLVRGETITEHDWWEAVWKDVPGLWI